IRALVLFRASTAVLRHSCLGSCARHFVLLETVRLELCPWGRGTRLLDHCSGIAERCASHRWPCPTKRLLSGQAGAQRLHQRIRLLLSGCRPRWRSEEHTSELQSPYVI